jgi:hypothetical protein
MVNTLLIGLTVRICHYWTYERGQERMFLTRLTDKNVGLLTKVDYDILSQGLISLIEYSYQ